MARSARGLVGTGLGGHEPGLSALQQIKTEPGIAMLFRQLLVDPAAADRPGRGSASAPGGRVRRTKCCPSCSMGLVCRASLCNQPESQKIPEIFRGRVLLKAPKFLCYCSGGLCLWRLCGQDGRSHPTEDWLPGAWWHHQP